jgi:DNA transformation protein
MGELIDMPNVGRVLAENLRAVGVQTPDDLIRLGSRDAFIRIRQSVDDGACLHMLYGLEGAVQGIPDSQLSAEDKDSLKSFFRDLESS